MQTHDREMETDIVFDKTSRLPPGGVEVSLPRGKVPLLQWNMIPVRPLRRPDRLDSMGEGRGKSAMNEAGERVR